jgi:hypothetical protein
MPKVYKRMDCGTVWVYLHSDRGRSFFFSQDYISLPLQQVLLLMSNKPINPKEVIQ